MPTIIKQQQKCVSGKFKRMNYFHGMLLDEQDMREEQFYLREKLKLHNRLHGVGVVWGVYLKKGCVEVETKDGTQEITKIFIEPGVALDCLGNEIVLCEDFLVPLDEKIEELRKFGLLTRLEGCEPPEYEGPKLYMGIKYCECESQPAEQFTSECDDDRLRPQFSRVREGFCVVILTEDQYQDCIESAWSENGKASACDCPGMPPCSEEEMIIFLGSVEKYDVNHPDLPNHKDATITPIKNQLSTVAEIEALVRPDTSWERHKLLTLNEVFRHEEDWTDVSVLIGQGTADIQKRIEEMGLNFGEIYQPPLSRDNGDLETFLKLLEKAKCALPWAKTDPENSENAATVDVVTDSEGKCVIFVLVTNPEAPAG